uniref:SLC26A/SulP transporter domain-containing protein n=1 Tax=Callorhinchus milii TaxID=7868 RepID=A0A4W3JUL4_CALMI
MYPLDTNCLQIQIFCIEPLSPTSAQTAPKQNFLSSSRCSQSKAKSLLFRFIPILVWIPKYPYKDWLLNDIISGLSVGIMQLPQSMAYALLAGVPPAFGLYTAFYPVLIYFTFGTSRHVSIGTFAVLSVMIGTVTERLAPDGDFVISSDNSTNATLVIDIAARDLMRVKVATLLTFFSGIVLGLIKFGFVVTYLSDPLVRGYTTAAAIHVLISQLKYVFGINIPRYNGPLSLIYSAIDICKALPLTNIATLVISIIVMVTLYALKLLNDYIKSKSPLPIPIELLEVVIATVVSANCNLTGKYGVDVVGSIPKGLQAPVLPEFEMSSSIIGDAFAVAIVGYGITISLGKIFGLKHGYQVDSNQELIALGLSNFVGGFFQCFGVSCSMSRSLVQESTGGQTQLASVVSCILILVVILEIGSLFSALPKAVLASIIIINLQGMFKQFRDICHFWKTNKVDLMIWVVTLLSTVLLGMDIGLAASVGFALLTVIFQTQLPTYSILGQVPMTDIYRDITKFDTAKEISGIKIFQSTATIYFANAELYEEALKKKVRREVLFACFNHRIKKTMSPHLPSVSFNNFLNWCPWVTDPPASANSFSLFTLSNPLIILKLILSLLLTFSAPRRIILASLIPPHKVPHSWYHPGKSPLHPLKCLDILPKVQCPGLNTVSR